MDMPRVSRFRLVSRAFVLHGPPHSFAKDSSLPTARRSREPSFEPNRTTSSASASSTDRALDAAPASHRVKSRLLQEVAGTNRGALAKLSRHRIIEDLIHELERSCSGQSPPAIDGTWELVYTTVEAFRSSPFFWAFQEGLVQDTDLAATIFKLTDSIPGAEVGRAIQRVDLAANSLISEVELSVFPGLTGTVVTTSSVTHERDNIMNVSVRSTRVAGSNLFPFLDSIVVPVQEIFERIRGAGCNGVSMQCTYVDDDLRISRTVHDNEIFVYRRVPA